MVTMDILDEAVFAALLESLGDDVEFLGELVEAYTASSPGLIAAMRTAIANGEATELQRAAHSLKSGSLSLGALAFAAQCRELEEMGRSGTLEGAAERVSALEAAYARVAAALEARMRVARILNP